MTGMSIQIKGLKELHRRLDALDDLGPLMRDIALSAVAEEKRLSPVKTGNLRRSINVGRVTDRSAEVIARAEYAAYVEFGTKPHEIRPRNRRALSWKGRGGKAVFAKYVRHPGTRAQPFMIPGAQKALEGTNLRERIYNLWNRAA